ncbi:hypothetical protein, partial [Kitasatospora sp. NPDC056531]|uniref:hypothetical protein n=1 Tax=Kitasatospora sp. NPDC056531 TaxID=3345856 RepID=UPI0036756A92
LDRLVELLLAATLFVAQILDPLGEPGQSEVFFVGAEPLVGTDAESEGLSLRLDGVCGLLEEVAAFAVLVVAGNSTFLEEPGLLVSP